MNDAPPIAALAVGRSATRRRILALLLADPAARYHLREIQRRVGTTPGTASRELASLLAAGLIEREAEGQHVFFRGGTSPFAEMLRSLIAAEASATPELPAPEAPFPSPADLDAVRRFSTELHEEFGARLRDVVLCRQRVPGPADPTAELGFVVVLDGFDSYADVLERSGRPAVALSLERGVVVRRILVTDAEWQERRDELLAAGERPEHRGPAGDAIAPEADRRSARDTDPGRELAAHAAATIEAANADLQARRIASAMNLASEAFVQLAAACLERDGVLGMTPDAVLYEYLGHFGGGGRMYAAHYRWLLDACDLAHAFTLGLSGCEDETAVAIAVERADVFRDAVDRFLERTA